MANVNLSRMTVAIRKDRRSKDYSRRTKRIERKESPTEISWSVRRDLGRPWCKTSLACCGDQGRKETR
jgi:hypothetical protein